MTHRDNEIAELVGRLRKMASRKISMGWSEQARSEMYKAADVIESLSRERHRDHGEEVGRGKDG